MRREIVSQIARRRVFTPFTLLGVLAVSGFGCDAKTSSFFGPSLLDPSVLPDIDAPVYSTIRPIAGISALNSNVLSFTLTDPAGTNGATPSGVDVSSVIAKTSTGVSIPLTANGLNFTGSFAGLSDGTTNLSLTAKDKAGNTGTSSLQFFLKRSPPIIFIPSPPPTGETVSDPSVAYGISGRITDTYFNSAQVQITQPGPDNTCGTSDDVLWPVGSSGGQISGNVYDLTPQVKQNPNGAFSAQFTAYNGVPPGGSARTATYCWVIRALDVAKDENGADKPNVATANRRTDLTWTAPTFTFTLNPTCQHFSGFSTVYLDVNTSPAQTDAAYTASVTGPSGGVQGSGQFSGNLDAQGHASLQNNINLFGTYNWSVTVGTVTATAQKIVNSTSCQ